MKIETSKLSGMRLDYAVAIVEGMDYWRLGTNGRIWSSDVFTPATDWAQGGPIIERERIDLRFEADCSKYSVPAQDMWVAVKPFSNNQGGRTPLIAAMRCYVASKLGAAVDIPDDLL